MKGDSVEETFSAINAPNSELKYSMLVFGDLLAG